MNRVLNAPKLTYKCTHCDATCEASESEFKPLGQYTGQFLINCAYCTCEITVSPRALLSKQAGEYMNRVYG